VGQKFLPLLPNPLLAQMSTEKSCVVMLQDGNFFSLDVCHAVHDEASGASVGNK
jgi:hypothetical protein